MVDFLWAVVLLAGVLYGILFIERKVVQYRKAKKNKFIEIHKELYDDYDVHIDGFRLRFVSKNPDTPKQQFHIQVYPVVRQVFELMSSETDKTESHYYTFVTKQMNTLLITLPAEADMDLFLEPLIVKSIMSTSEHDNLKDLVEWHTEFIEKHGVNERSMYREHVGYEYRYRITLLNVPCQPWYEQETLERTEWLKFPGTPSRTRI